MQWKVEITDEFRSWWKAVSVQEPSGENGMSGPLGRKRILELFDELRFQGTRAQIYIVGGATRLPPSTCCHTFRATGITAYLSNGGTLDHAQQIAEHASPKTTKLYDRTADTLTLDEIERIVI